MNFIGRGVLLVLMLTIVGCKTWWYDKDEQNNPYQGMSAKELYTEARQELTKEQYSAAIKHLEALDTMYPFHDDAERAEMDLIYAYYKKEDYASCEATAERFIHMYPRAKHADYAYYMKGMADFQQNRGALANVIAIDQSWRDPGTKFQAYADFGTLIQKFPNSRYSADALQRMIYLRNMFAQREFNTATYYYERQMYVAANERLNYLIKTYPQAPIVKSALTMLYHSNQKLGLTKATAEVLRVYQATYHENPGSVALNNGVDEL